MAASCAMRPISFASTSRTVTPANHATASLYAYTPWVLVGRGGNWLVWNISKKYVKYAEDEGLIPTTP